MIGSSVIFFWEIQNRILLTLVNSFLQFLITFKPKTFSKRNFFSWDFFDFFQSKKNKKKLKSFFFNNFIYNWQHEKNVCLKPLNHFFFNFSWTKNTLSECVNDQVCNFFFLVLAFSL